MPIMLHMLNYADIENVLPILNAADEDEERVRTLVTDTAHTTYAAFDAQELVGAISVRWEEEESEIEYIAVKEGSRGCGYGKMIMAALLEEATRRGVHAVLVGTANSSCDTITFYQKCGFRMDSVRRDFFDYIQPPLVQNGIPMRDMLMLRYENPLTAQE